MPAAVPSLRAELDALRRRYLGDRAASEAARRDAERARRSLEVERRALQRSAARMTARQSASTLRRRLEAAGISQTRVAKAARLSLSSVCYVLSGRQTNVRVVAAAERLLTRARRRRQNTAARPR